MYPVSQGFLDALAPGYTQRVRVDLLLDGIVEVSTDNDLVVIGGSVTRDRKNAIRGQATFSIVDPDGAFVPEVPSDLLSSVSGAEFRIYRGLVLSDGTEELVPLITAGIAAAKTSDTTQGLTIEVEGYDRSRQIARNRFTVPYQIAAGQNYATVIEALILDRRPGTVVSVSGTGYETPLLVFPEQEDPWVKGVMEMAANVGMEAYFDVSGIAVVAPLPDETTAPVFELVEGETTTLLSLTRPLSNEQVYNGVIVTGESPSLAAPVRGEAWDDDPGSPTYRLGRYGEVPFFYSSPFVTTEDQAESAAGARLAQVKGLTEALEFALVPNPALEPGDVIHIDRERSKVDANYVIDRVSVPLGPEEAMTVVTRERRL